jgi:Transposase DDE domain group 1
MLLAMAERRLGVADRLARCFPDRRDPTRITHTLSDMIRARIFAISCGYEDADDLDFLRTDPAFKLACGKLPDTGSDLCSQPTLSRLENAPSLKDAIHLTWALVDQWMVSYEGEPVSVTLDIDDTCDVVHGHQQLSLFNAHYDERCFLPIHVYQHPNITSNKRPSERMGNIECERTTANACFHEVSRPSSRAWLISYKPIPAKGPMRANPDRRGKINCGDAPTTSPIPTRG